MSRVLSTWFAIGLVGLSAVPAAAASSKTPLDRNVALEPSASANAQAPVRRDSLWNGIVIGAAAGVGTVVALDAALCDVPDGRCDTPWLAYFTLGGIGAAAGAGIDFLIGRKPDEAKTTLRLAPMVGRTSKGVRASIRF